MANLETDGPHSSGTKWDGEAGRGLTGRAVLVWLLSFFGIIIAVNALMAKLAVDTMPGTEVDSPYQAGNAYNAQISAARDQDARRWRVQAHVGRGDDGRTIVEVEAHDSDGQPLDDLAFSARLERPIDRRGDRSLTLVERAAGIYSSVVTDLTPGQWDLVLEANRGAQPLFLSRNRVVLQSSGEQ
jgi:nitrogen fixation protein FixH